MYVCISVYNYTNTHTICAHVQRLPLANIHTYMHTCLHMHKDGHLYMRTCVYMSACTCLPVHVSQSMYVRMYVCMHVCIYVRMHAFIMHVCYLDMYV